MGASEHKTVIVGAGPAGLAVGACLRRRDESFLILERNEALASSWRSHYDRLHLHTDKSRSQLPYVRYPRSYPKYPSRSQVVHYLEAYASEFDLSPVFGQEVRSITRDETAWEIETQQHAYRCENVVIATGYSRVPVVPEWPGMDIYSGEVVHSSAYRNGSSYNEKAVLVVGFGNSGGEIAIDLVEHGADVSVSVRSPVNILPKELFGIPILGIAVLATKLPTTISDFLTTPILRLKFGDLRSLGLRKLPYGPLTQIKRDGRIPLIDIGTVKLIKGGQISVRPGVKQFGASGVTFEDDTASHFDAVILATGFRPDIQKFLRVPTEVDKNGTPLVSGGDVGSGLYFCGFYVSPTGMLREIATEAKRIARQIAA